jgi:hypothetical protein
LGTIGRKIRTETFPNDELIPVINIYIYIYKKKREGEGDIRNTARNPS